MDKKLGLNKVFIDVKKYGMKLLTLRKITNTFMKKKKWIMNHNRLLGDVVPIENEKMKAQIHLHHHSNGIMWKCHYAPLMQTPTLSRP